MSDRSTWRLESQNENLRDELARQRLTDAEREAVEKLRKWAYEIARDNAFIDEVCDAADAAHKALTAFLERHK